MEEFQQQLDCRPVLDNHLILDNVLQYLIYKDVCNFRLASMSSYQNSLRVWLDKAPCLQLYNTQQNISQGRNYRGTIEEFLHQFHDGSRSYGHSEFKGIRQYKNFGLNFLGSIEQSRVLNSFLASCGPWISCLCLTKFDFEDLNTFDSVHYCVHTPNLKKLEVTACGYNFDASRLTAGESHSRRQAQTGVEFLTVDFGLVGPFPILEWADFLNHYPSLKHLSINLPEDQVWNLLDAIKVIRAEGNKLALTYLDVDGPSQYRPQYGDANRLVAFYKDSTLPLRSLSINCHWSLSPTHVNSLISSHSSSLKSLHISCDDEHEPWDTRLDSTLPGVEGLHNLTLNGCVILNLKVLNIFPNLTELDLESVSDEFEDTRKLISASMEEDMSGVVFYSLKSFKYWYNEVCGRDKIQRIQAWMPNLTAVLLTVTNDGFEEVCKSWPLLESIVVNIGLDGDDVVPVEKLSIDIPYQIPKNIANLTRLRKLDISAYNPWTTPQTRPRRLVADRLEFEFPAGGVPSRMRVFTPWVIYNRVETLRNRNPVNQHNRIGEEEGEDGDDVVTDEALIQAQRLANMSKLFFVGGAILYLLASLRRVCP